eukprot:GHVU01111846.1.p1 GENE.GHVU01111846.1~~GHVU01111846.1.p1  ORF type:complete len:109 (-),score=11.63 GHVU01111846.1:463-789(-)
MSDRALTVAALLVHVCVCVCACAPSPVRLQQRRGCCCSNRLLLGCCWIQAKIYVGGYQKDLSKNLAYATIENMDVAQLVEAIQHAAMNKGTPASKDNREERRKEGNEK